MNLIDSRY